MSQTRSDHCKCAGHLACCLWALSRCCPHYAPPERLQPAPLGLPRRVLVDAPLGLDVHSHILAPRKLGEERPPRRSAEVHLSKQTHMPSFSVCISIWVCIV
ncbi:hypothetical protein Ddc_16242 [Ditylenchus destructor]|nr:hypothetical protein Ddc_16242 [Ditylenchus destructor]